MSQQIAENTQNIQYLNEELKKKMKADEKVRLCLDFMIKALSQNQDADFKAFWESKAKCLEFFKEDLSPYIRERLWNEYLEINQQEKGLRAHLEKEASFAKEQIILAIEALQKDIENIHTLIAKGQDVALPKLDVQMDLFEGCQKELNILNVLAEKSQSLKKEIISTQIRYRDKNLFLKKISDIADRIYPRRKALILEISDAFQTAVEAFAKTITPSGLKTIRLYEVKEKIKELQSAAKVLTLNVTTFTKTRAHLSGLWNRLKKMDDEKRKVSFEKKEIYAQNFEQVQSKINEIIKSKCEQNLDEQSILKAVETLLLSMKELELDRKDVRLLKGKIEEIQEEILGKDVREKERIEKKQVEKILDLKNNVLALVRGDFDKKTLLEKINIFEKELPTLSMSQAEESLIKDLLATAGSMIPGDDGDPLACLEALKDFKKELRMRIESYRRLLGGSTQDFERSFIYQELLEKEKNLFKDLEKSIEKMEDKALDLI